MTPRGNQNILKHLDWLLTQFAQTTPSLRPNREANLVLLVLFPTWKREFGLSGASTDIFFQEKRISGHSFPARVLTLNDPERYKEQHPRAAATATTSPGQARAPSAQSYFATPPNEIFLPSLRG